MSLASLAFWLNNKIPLFGGWIRQRAARSLAADPAFKALEILALAYEHPDYTVRTIVWERLDTIEADQPAVDAICRAWMVTRSPALGGLLEQRGWVAASPASLRAYSALRANRLDLLRGLGANIVRPLLNAAAEQDQLLAARAIECLKTLSSQPAVNTLCEIWVQTRNNPKSPEQNLQKNLDWLILTAGYVATTPPQVRVLSALKAARPQDLAASRPAHAPFLIDALNDPDPEIAQMATPAIAGLQRPETRDAVFKQHFQAEYPGLETAILQGGYLPTQPADRALFLFLTGQWAPYEDLDFDHSLLRTIFEAANPSLRERVMRALRQAGRVNYLTIITGRDETERLHQMGPTDFDLLTNMLTGNQEWPRLWVLAQKLPPLWSVRIVQHLAKSGWQPQDGTEQALLAELSTLAGTQSRGGLVGTLQTLNRQTPPAVERARLTLHHGKLNGVAFDPRSPILALVSSRRRVVLWNYRTGTIARVIKTTVDGERFGHSLGEVCYTQRGDLVFAERTRGDEFCRLYAEVDGEVRPIFNETGSITALVPLISPDGASLGDASVLAAGRSMFVSRLNLASPNQPAVRQYFTNWARGLAVSADGQTAALLQQGITLVRTDTLARVAWGYGGGQVIPYAAFTSDGKTVIAGRLNGEVRLFHTGDYMESERRGLPHHRGPVRGVIAFRKFPLVLTAGADGLMRFTTWPERKRYGESGQDGDTISGLSLSRDESSLAVIHGEDRIALWDLRPLELPELLSQPLVSLSPTQFASLQGLAALDGLPEGLHRAINFSVRLLHHRFRYDVEVETTADIAPGEFDIELDEEVEIEEV